MTHAADVNDIEFHLTRLSEAGQYVNKLQNEIASATLCLSNVHNQFRKRLHYLRLKYGRRVQEAQAYHRAKKESSEIDNKVEKAQRTVMELQNRLERAKDSLTMVPVDENPSIENIKVIREMWWHSLEDFYGYRSSLESKRMCLNELEQTHKRSIHLTKEYFELQTQAENLLLHQREIVMKLRKQLNHWKEEYRIHMHHLESISKEKHMERAMQSVDTNLLAQMASTKDDANVEDFACRSKLVDALENGSKSDSAVEIDDVEDSPNISTAPISHTCPQVGSSSSCFTSKAELNSSAISFIKIPLRSSGRGRIISREQNVQIHPLS